MVGKDIDPSEIGKHPIIIKAAQREMTQSDVLVCGKCHSVFHFIDLFIEHKEDDENCSKESTLKDCRETKPKVWAFLLWKSAQLSNSKNQDSHMNSWQLYQTWVKMDESVRETWVVAGKTIQSFNRVGQGTLQEMPVKITKTVIDAAPPKNMTANNRLASPVNRIIKKEEGSEDDSQRALKNQANLNQALQKNNPIIIKANQNCRKAKRTIANSDATEFKTVEKIVAKRFNPRRKVHEYLVKWEGYPYDQNTWEPQMHLDTCPQLLETFEKQLARQKEQRAAQERARMLQQQQQPQQQTNAVNNISQVVGSTTVVKKENVMEKPATVTPAIVSPLSPQSRVLRGNLTSIKAKTDDEKANSFNDTDSTLGNSGGIKRKLDDSDFNANTTGEEDFEEDAIPVHAVKRLKNGTTITTSSAKMENKISTQISKTLNGTVKSPTKSDNSAEVVIIKDSNSGIVRKSNAPSSPNQKGEASVRILSRGENTSSGIVRLSGSTPNLTAAHKNPVQQRLIQKSNSAATLNQTPKSGVAQIARPAGGLNNQQRSLSQLIRPTGQTQRTQITRSLTPSVGNQPRPLQSQAKTTTIYRPSSLSPGGATTPSSITIPQSGRMVINRNARPTQGAGPKAITPEEKILQLSKSGDLKITRKTIPSQSLQQQQTRTPIGSQNRLGQPRTGMISQQQRTQQLTSKPKLQTIATKLPTKSRSPSPPRGLTLCPITGKILSESGEEIPPPASTPEKKEENHQQQGVVATQLQFTNEQDALATEGTTITLSDGQQILANEDGTPLLVSGDDGTIYQVAGKNAEGQTILIAQGADGEQQFAYVAAEENDTENGNGGGGVLTLDNAVAEAVANMLPEQQAEALSNVSAANGAGNEQQTQYVIKQEDGTVVTATAAEAAANVAAVAAASGGQLTIDTNQTLTIQTTGGSDGTDSQDANIPAEVVQADHPSPGGTRRVILLLQDGTFMMTEMHDDEYQALNIQ